MSPKQILIIAAALIVTTAILIVILLAKSEGVICEEGTIITCNKDTDCGPSGSYGEKYCREGAVWQQTITNQCLKQGTCEAECLAAHKAILIEECEQDCREGTCT